METNRNEYNICIVKIRNIYCALLVEIKTRNIVILSFEVEKAGNEHQLSLLRRTLHQAWIVLPEASRWGNYRSLVNGSDTDGKS